MLRLKSREVTQKDVPKERLAAVRDLQSELATTANDGARRRCSRQSARGWRFASEGWKSGRIGVKRPEGVQARRQSRCVDGGLRQLGSVSQADLAIVRI